MSFSAYDGNIHPDEWISKLEGCLEFKQMDHNISYALSLVDPIISLPTGINNLDKLRNALKEDNSFTAFKNTNKRKLELLNYISERNGGDTSGFISNFRKLCYNAEINNIEEQMKYFYPSLLRCDSYDYFLSEFLKRKEKIKSMNDLIKEFEEIVMDESNLIRNNSIVALKHVATGKYLSSIENLNYTTGSETQLVCFLCCNSNTVYKRHRTNVQVYIFLGICRQSRI